jgi:exo-beta-1,3-glucanase (GH17 family)
MPQAALAQVPYAILHSFGVGSLGSDGGELDDLGAVNFGTVYSLSDDLPADSSAPTPIISPDGGTITIGQAVTISDTLSGASIYYTTDGSTPSSSSILYTGAITISASETIDATAVETGYSNSAVASASFTAVPSSWTAASLSVGPDGNSHLLWDRNDGSAAFWTMDANGNNIINNTYGPFPGWTAKSIVTDSSNNTYALWDNGNGSVTVWKESGSGKFAGLNTFGPFPGWTAKSMSVGGDGLLRLLWTNTNGSITDWVGNGMTFTGQPVFGPYAGWSAQSIATDSGNQTHLLWTNSNGSITNWVGNGVTFTGQPVFGPFSGWSAIANATAPDKSIRILWDNTNGQMTTWEGDGNTFTGEMTFGPFSDWTGIGIAVGGDSLTRILWGNVSGAATIWTLSGNSNTSTPTYGPFITQVGNKLSGVCFGQYINGMTSPGQTVTTDQLQEELAYVANNFKSVRFYSSTGGMENAPAIAKMLGLTVAAGCLIDSTQTAEQTQLEIMNLINNCNAGDVDVAVVGNETLDGGVLTPAQLIGYINEVRAAIPSTIPVTTADTWDELVNNPDVIAACDQVWANIYPYWEAVSIQNDVSQLNSDYTRLSDMAGTKKIVISESGWPSGGTANGSAVPSVANGAQYFSDFVSWADGRGIPFYYFEMFDEVGKKPEPGGVDAYWGLWSNSFALKPGYAAGFIATASGSGPSFPYTAIPNVPQAVNNLGFLIGQEQADVVTPGGTANDPLYSAADQQAFDSSGKLSQIVQTVEGTTTFSAGVSAIEGLSSSTQAAVYSAFETADWPTWATLGQVSSQGTTSAGYAVEEEIADGLTTAVQQAVSSTSSTAARKAKASLSLPALPGGVLKSRIQANGSILKK